MKITLRSFLVSALFSLGCLSLSAFATEKTSLPILDRVIATVNTEAITESEVNRQMQLFLVHLRQTDLAEPPSDVLRKQLLDKLVLEKLQLQLAKLVNIEVDEATLNRALEEIARRDGLPLEQLKGFLQEQGVTFAQFKETVKNEITISKLQQQEIGHHINISKNELEHFMQSAAGRDQTGTEYRLAHILISLPENPTLEEQQKAENEAKGLVAKLKNGTDFAQTAIAHSKGVQALNGGDLGFRKAAELPTLFAKIAPTLHPGEVHGPLKNSSGYHIIKLVAKRQDTDNNKDSQLTAQLMRDKAMDALYQHKFEEKLTNWLRRLRDEAEIDIHLNNEAQG